MKKAKNFDLIKGLFTPREALEILTNIYSGKIQFHELKNFSSKIRLGKEDKNSKTRVAELKKSLKEIQSLLNDSKVKKSKIRIESVLTVGFSDTNA